MNRTRPEQRLLDDLADIPVIDAHEHLWPEARRLARKVDFFLLFGHYCRADLHAAGMAGELTHRCREDQDMPVDEKWRAFAPFYPMIKHGAYAQPARIWLKDVLGYADLTERNYRAVSEKLQDGNRPGLYDRILRRMCHIESALIPAPPEFALEEYGGKLLKPLWQAVRFASGWLFERFRVERTAGRGRTLADYLDWMEARFDEARRVGVFGIKAWCWPAEPPDYRRADRIFRSLFRGGKVREMTPAEATTVKSVVYDRAFQLARREKLTVAMHSGVWGDFRESQPTHLIPVAMRYPDVAFDLFHLGAPYYHEAVMIGKMFPNVSLNLCWNSVMSPEVTVRLLDECLDLVPINRIILFGGDYNMPVEKVYGHLKMAKSNAARVLGRRVARGDFDHAEAMRIATLWFHDNAENIYRLPRRRRGT